MDFGSAFSVFNTKNLTLNDLKVIENKNANLGVII